MDAAERAARKLVALKTDVPSVTEIAASIRAEYQELVDAAEYITEGHCDSLHMKLRDALRKVKP